MIVPQQGVRELDNAGLHFILFIDLFIFWRSSFANQWLLLRSNILILTSIFWEVNPRDLKLGFFFCLRAARWTTSASPVRLPVEKLCGRILPQTLLCGISIFSPWVSSIFSRYSGLHSDTNKMCASLFRLIEDYIFHRCEFLSVYVCSATDQWPV